MSGPMNLPHHFKPAMSPPVRSPAQQQQQQQQQQQDQQSPQHIFNQLQVASTSGPAVNAAMGSSEEVTGVRANSQFLNNITNTMANPHFQVGSLANYRARVQTHQNPPRRENPWRSLQKMTNIDPQAVRNTQAQRNPCEYANAHRPPQNRIIVDPQSPRNAHGLALHHLQNYRAPAQAHFQPHVQAMQNPQHPQGQAGPLPPELAQAQMQAQIQPLLLSLDPANRALTQTIVDWNHGTGFPLSPVSSPTRNERYSGHDGQGNNGIENRSEGDGRDCFMPTLQGFQHQDNRNEDSPIRPTLQGFQHQVARNEGSPKWNRIPNRNGGQQLPLPWVNPHTRHQNSHRVANSNHIYRPALNFASPPRQSTQASPDNPCTSSPRQPVLASPPHPLRTVASANEAYGRLQYSLPPSSRAIGPTPNARVSAPTRRPTATPVSHRSPAPAQNHGTELKRMLNTGTSQYAEGPPTKRPHLVPPASTGPSIGHFALPVIPRPANVAVNPAICPSSVVSSRRSVQPINSSSPQIRSIDRYAYKGEFSGKQWTWGLLPGHDTAMETSDIPSSPKALKTTREHINDDEGLGYDKPDEETGDPFSGFREEAKYLNPDDLYRYLGHKLPSEAKQRTEPDIPEQTLDVCYKAESKLELDMLAKRFGVRLSKVDTGQGGVNLAVRDNVWLALGRKLKVAHYPLPEDPEEVLATEKAKEDARKTVVDLTGPDITPLVFYSTLTGPMVTLPKLTARRPLSGVDLARCTADEDGGLRAPNPESPTEQHADLMWLLKSQEEKDMHDQSENDESRVS